MGDAMIISACSDIGERESNQDAYFINDIQRAKKKYSKKGRVHSETLQIEEGMNAHCVGVLDGVGGAASGGDAARTAMMTPRKFKQLECREEDLRDYLDRMNNNVLHYYERKNEKGATTLAFAYLWKKEQTWQLCSCNIGDSPIYLLRDGELEVLSIEQTYAEVLRRAGLTNISEEDENILEHYIGNEKKSGYKQACIEIKELQEDDILMLCSDGISKNLTSKEIVKLLKDKKTVANDFVSTVKRKKAQGKIEGSLDNMTIVLLKIGMV